MDNKLPAATIQVVKQTDTVTVYSLISPAPFFANATHIIELPTQLILVDGHYFAQYAKEFREYADTLGKPITRFYVSHDHPDHFIGMGDFFKDIEVYALAETLESIATHGPAELEEKQQKFGDLIARTLIVPQNVVTTGTEVIEGVAFEFGKIEGAESGVALTIGLPELGVIIAQDLLYNQNHPFITGDTSVWENLLLNLKADDQYNLYLAGHGAAGGNEIIDAQLEYFKEVKALLNAGISAEEYKAALLAKYPEYGAAGLLDIYLPILFATA